MSQESQSTRISFSDMVYIDKNAIGNIDQMPADSFLERRSAIPYMYDWCELYERLCRRVDLPHLDEWEGLGKPREDIYFEPLLWVPKATSLEYVDNRGIMYGIEALVDKCWELVYKTAVFLDPNAPIINAPTTLGYGDSTLGAGCLTDGDGNRYEYGNAKAHTIGQHVFWSTSDATQDVELATVNITDDSPPVRLPAHGIYYYPEGHTKCDYPTGEAYDMSNDRYVRVGGRHTICRYPIRSFNWVATQIFASWGFYDIDQTVRTVMQLAWIYPNIIYWFKDHDLTQPYDISDQGVAASAFSRYKTGKLEGSGIFSWESTTDKESLDEQGLCRAFLCPEPVYTYNYWHHNGMMPEEGSWGPGGAEKMRQMYRPPFPETVLPSDRWENRYPPSASARGGAADSDHIMTTMMTNLRNNHWTMRNMHIRLFTYLYKWLDQLKYTIYPVDRYEYAIDASVNYHYENIGSTGTLVREKCSGGIHWRGPGANFDLRGLRIEGGEIHLPTFQYSTNCIDITKDVSIKTTEGEGGGTSTETSQNISRFATNCFVKVSKIRPIYDTDGSGCTREEEGKCYFKYDITNTDTRDPYDPDRTSPESVYQEFDRTLDVTPLVTSEMTSLMDECKLYAVVRIEVRFGLGETSIKIKDEDNPGNDMLRNTPEITAASADGVFKSPCMSMMTRYKILDLGTPDDNGVFSGEIYPYDLIQEVLSSGGEDGFPGLQRLNDMPDEMFQWCEKNRAWLGTRFRILKRYDTIKDITSYKYNEKKVKEIEGSTQTVFTKTYSTVMNGCLASVNIESMYIMIKWNF